MRLLRGLALLVLAFTPLAAVGADKPKLAIVAGNAVDAKGEIVAKGLITVAGEKIAHVGGDAPAGVEQHTYSTDAVICAGFIDCYAALGAAGDLTEKNALEPNARARDAFDRFHSHMARALQAGVTTFALAPAENNLIGGQIAICQTSGPELRPRVLIERGPMMLSLSPAVFREEREPTSRAGALAMLRGALATGAKGPKDSGLGLALAGKTPIIIAAPSGADVASAIQLFQPYKLSPVIVHTDDARLVAADVNGAVAGAIVGPLDFDSPMREAEAAARFERAGVSVALTGHLPFSSEQSLRVAAAVAARNGLSKSAARRAITSTAAELLGIADRVGSLKKDAQADVLVFSGDPLDLRSRLLAVYIAGERVYVAPTIENEPR